MPCGSLRRRRWGSACPTFTSSVAAERAVGIRIHRAAERGGVGRVVRGEHEGLGLLKGSVVPMQGVIPAELKIPHIGWNALKFVKKSPLFRFINEGDCVYFVHSYYATDCSDSVIATAEYGAELTAAVESGNIKGCQFHPEKSGYVGLNILRAFCQGG